MSVILGLLFAFAAVLFWGFGDFLIQRSTRKFGDWETLFIITSFGAIILTPFVYNELYRIFSDKFTFFILATASVILLLAALLEFESLKRGKISVIEPLWSIEIPVSSLLAFLVLNEKIRLWPAILIFFLIVGLVLVSLRSYHLTKKIWLEKAVFLAFFAAMLMGAANFFVGWGARITNALVVNWLISIVSAGACLIYLVSTKKISRMFKNIKSSRGDLLTMCIFDNAAWIAFAFSMILAPIAISVAISESYIIVAVLLGIFVNKEFLKTHQKIGLLLAIVSAIALAATANL